MERGPDS